MTACACSPLARPRSAAACRRTRRMIVQRMEIKGFSSCPQHGQVILEDPDGMVQLHIRMRPMMAHWLAHELQECRCPSVSMYRLIQELLNKFGGILRVAMIDASTDNTPLGLLVISCPNGEEIQQACHPADAIAMTARTHVPLYATSRALKMGRWKTIQPWLETVKPQDFK
jgi:bifunctional DNase/RNase